MHTSAALGINPQGDTAFRADVISQLNSHGVNFDHVAACFCDGTTGETKLANIGTIRSTWYSIASLSKPMLGHLFADSITRAEVTAATTIGTLLPALTGGVAGVQCRNFATHTAGLPSIPSVEWGASNANYIANGTDPYIWSVSQLCAHASRDYNAGNLGVNSYSNMGASLLGQALAAAAGTSYDDLIENRLFKLLGMGRSYMPVTAGGLAPEAPEGYNIDQARYVDIWTMNGYCPAGGVQTTISDYAKFLHAVMAGTAPGMDATALHTTGDNTTTGWFWGRWIMGDSSVRLEHNGAVGGYDTYVGVDITNNKALGIFSARGGTGASVTSTGQALLVAYGGGS